MKATQREAKYATIAVSILLLILLVLPGESRELVEAMGIKIKDVNKDTAVVALVLALVVYRLAGLLADAARLCRALDCSMRISFELSEKFSLDLGSEDGSSEAGLFPLGENRRRAALTAAWIYWISRIPDLMGAYTILLIIVGCGFFEAGMLALRVPPWKGGSISAVALGWATLMFLALGLLRIAQYWTVRHPSLGLPTVQKNRRSINPPLIPKTLSWTSVLVRLGIIVGCFVSLIVRFVFNFAIWSWARFALKPVGRLITLPWKSKLLTDVEMQKYFAELDKTSDELERQLQSMGHGQRLTERLSRKLTLWQKIARYLYG